VKSGNHRLANLKYARTREWLSLQEAAVLADLTDIRAVRKDIELGVFLSQKIVGFESRVCVTWPDLVAFSVIYKNDILTAGMRKHAFEVLAPFTKQLKTRCLNTPGEEERRSLWINWRYILDEKKSFKLDEYITLEVGSAWSDVRPRVDIYSEGLGRIEERSGVLGGEAVFRGTRLSVTHVGEMYDRGEQLENILEDYPYLNANDVEFARLYYKSHPPRGRPRQKMGAADGDATAA
jgi:uncharacterized protein (DUF433 family)